MAVDMQCASQLEIFGGTNSLKTRRSKLVSGNVSQVIDPHTGFVPGYQRTSFISKRNCILRSTLFLQVQLKTADLPGIASGTSPQNCTIRNSADQEIELTTRYCAVRRKTFIHGRTEMSKISAPSMSEQEIPAGFNLVIGLYP